MFVCVYFLLHVLTGSSGELVINVSKGTEQASVYQQHISGNLTTNSVKIQFISPQGDSVNQVTDLKNRVVITVYTVPGRGAGPWSGWISGFLLCDRVHRRPDPHGGGHQAQAEALRHGQGGRGTQGHCRSGEPCKFVCGEGWSPLPTYSNSLQGGEGFNLQLGR